MDTFSLEIPLRLHVELHENVVLSELDADRGMRDFIRILNKVQCERIPGLQRSSVTGIARAGSFDLNGAIQLVFDSQKCAQEAYLSYDQQPDIYRDVIAALRLQFPGNIRKGHVELGRPQAIQPLPGDAPFAVSGAALTRFEFGDRGLSDTEKGLIAPSLIDRPEAERDNRFSPLWILPFLMLGLLALSLHNTRAQSEQGRRLEQLSALLSTTATPEIQQQASGAASDVISQAASDEGAQIKAPANPLILDIRIDTGSSRTSHQVELPASPTRAANTPHAITLDIPSPTTGLTPVSDAPDLAGYAASSSAPHTPRWIDLGGPPPSTPQINRTASTRPLARWSAPAP